MIWHLNYQINKKHFQDYWHKNKQKGWWKENRYKGTLHDTGTLFHLFHINDIADPVIKDLNLEGLNIKPRFRFSYPGWGQDTHIDIDNVIGINFNVFKEPIYLIMDGVKHYYECALLDVGKYPHSIPPVDHPRLIFKLTIRAKVEEVLERLKDAGHM